MHYLIRFPFKKGRQISPAFLFEMSKQPPVKCAHLFTHSIFIHYADIHWWPGLGKQWETEQSLFSYGAYVLWGHSITCAMTAPKGK